MSLNMDGDDRTFPPPSGVTPFSTIVANLPYSGPQYVQDHKAPCLVAPYCLDVLSLLEGCLIFNNNATKPKPSKLVLAIENPGPFEQWALNVIGPIPENKRLKRFLITAIDHATR